VGGVGGGALCAGSGPGSLLCGLIGRRAGAYVGNEIDRALGIEDWYDEILWSESNPDGRRFSAKDRQIIQDRSKGPDGDPTCAYCGQKTTNEPRKPNSSHIDHIQAFAKGGKTTIDNANNSCAACNLSKGAKDLGTEWTPPKLR
jgi:hypothetical protein